MIDYEKVIDAYVHQDLDRNQIQELMDWVNLSDENADCFVKVIAFHNGIKTNLISLKSLSENNDLDDSRTDLVFLQELESNKSLEPCVDSEGSSIRIFKEEKEYPTHRRIEKVKKKEGHTSIVIPRIAFYAAVASVAAMIFLVVLPSMMNDDTSPPIERISALPANVEIATIEELLEAKFSNDEYIAKSTVLKNRIIDLKEGLVKLRMRNGAIVILQGPCNVQLITKDEIYLHQGSLTGYCGENSRGFTVKFQGGKLVDLGTEFGINVREDQKTDIHVFTGKVTAELNNDLDLPPVELTKGQSAEVDTKYNQIDKIYDMDTSKFVKSMNLKLLLTDIIAGGDGKGYRTDRGIDQRTGKMLSLPNIPNRGNTRCLTKYINVPSNKHIDGVFTPGGINNRNEIDPLGSTLGIVDNKNLADQTFGNIWAGKNIPQEPSLEDYFTARFNGIDYLTNDDHTLVSMVTNTGFTIDLEELRDTHSKLKITKFKAVASTQYKLYAPLGYKDINGQYSLDFSILIDGKVRLHKVGMSDDTGVIYIDIEINDEDKFLTIVATDGDNSNGFDWLLLGDAVFHVTNK